MTKTVVVQITGDEAAVNAVIKKHSNLMDNLAKFANDNHPGLINSIKTSSNTVTVVKEGVVFDKDPSGALVLKP